MEATNYNGVMLDNVCAFSLAEDKTCVNVMELCDHYYTDELSKSELAIFIRSLTTLHHQMIEVDNGKSQT